MGRAGASAADSFREGLLGTALHVAPFSPVSPDSGGRVRIAATADALRRRWRLLAVYVEDDPARLEEARAAVSPGSVVIPGRSRLRFRSARSRLGDRGLRAAQLLALTLRLPATSLASDWSELDRALDASPHADVALVEFGQLAAWRPASVPSVVVAHDLNWRKQLLRSTFVGRDTRLAARAESTRLRLEAGRIERDEARAYARHDAVVVVSELDRDALESAWSRHRIAPKPVFVAPNGVDLERLASAADEPDAGTALFVGGLEHPPNRDAVSELVESIVPLAGPALERLVLVGSGTESFGGDRVHGVGRVADVSIWYRAAAITVAPIRWGSGTRVKILESLACGRPVVAYPEAVEGLEDLARTGAIVVVDDGRAFATAIERLLAEPALARALGGRGREAVARYDWRETLAPVEQALRAAISTHARLGDTRDGAVAC